MKAVYVREWPATKAIHWRLYRCEPGGRLPEYVIVSASAVGVAICAELGQPLRPGLEPETRIFASDAVGRVASFSVWLWEERGTLDHEYVLREAGYEPEGYPQ